MVNWKTFAPLLVLLQLPLLIFSTPSPLELQWEEVINRHIHSYHLSSDNLFKLAAYTELKGRYSPRDQVLRLKFGDLGSLTFYKNNCILKTPGNQVFHLSRGEVSIKEQEIMDMALFHLFENIPLLGNHDSDPEIVEFVDKNLAKKNIEPFDKLFIRHVLIRYGRFNQSKQELIFHTDFLPQNSYYDKNSRNAELIRKYKSPLKIRLDAQIIRGYYLDVGGTVYVEDVDRPVAYATSEQYTHNVTAFKVFMQKLMVQSVQYVTQSESQRLRNQQYTNPFAREKSSTPDGYTSQRVTQSDPVYSSDTDGQKVRKGALLSPYNKENWIPMMLAMLRAQEVNIGDPQILKYFIHEPYFPRIYEQLTREEKKLVDRY